MTTTPLRRPGRNLGRSLLQNWQLYVMLLLPIAFYIIFCYKPMLGVGIGMNGKSMSLHIKGMNVNRGSDETMALFAYEAPSVDEARGLGANGARVIKKRPLRLLE